MKAHLTLLSFLLILIPSFVSATHNMGKDLEYRCLGVVGGNLQYEVTLRYYRNCWDNPVNGQAALAPDSMTLDIRNQCNGTTSMATLAMDTSGTCPNKSGCQVTALCASQLSQSGCGWAGSGNPPYPGVQLYFYKVVVLLPIGCSNILLGVTDCCRNGSISNLPSPGSLYGSIQASVNTTIDPQTGQPYCNTSVAFSTLPVPFVCANSLVSYNHGAVDGDGDSLVYTQINPLQGSTLPYTSINYNAGWTATNPVTTKPPNTFGFNTQTGQLKFTPANTEQDVIAVQVNEYRNGVLVGSTMRDIQLVVINCLKSTPFIDTITSITNGFLSNTDEISVCPNSALSFSVFCADYTRSNLNLISSVTSAPAALPGATLNTTVLGLGPNDSVLAKFLWTPSIADSGCHYFSLTASNDDCPIIGSNSKTFKVCVQNKVVVTPKQAVYCGTPIQLTASGGGNGQWLPSAGLTSTNSLNTLASPMNDITYLFTSDCGVDSAQIVIKPAYNLNIDSDGTICQNGGFAINTTIDSQSAPHTIHWEPSTRLYDPVTGQPTDSILNPIAKPLSTTTYTIHCTDKNGCVETDTVVVDVNGFIPNIKVIANQTFVNSSDSVKLWAIVIPSVSGPTDTSCRHTTFSKPIDNILTTQGGAPSAYPAPYGNFFKSARHQYLIKATELNAIGIYGGTLKSLAMQVGTINSMSTLQNFTLSLGTSFQDSLTSFNENIIQVFLPKNVTPHLGWNQHYFDIPFDWDGQSNLIVDVCFSNPSGSAINNKMTIATKPYKCAYFTWGNTISQCGITGTQPSVPTNASLYQRPNFLFGVCNSSLDSGQITWTPNTGANACDPFDNDTTFANPIKTTLYTATLNMNGCTSASSIWVEVDTVSKLFLKKDTSICAGQLVQLNAYIKPNKTIYDSCTFNWTSTNPNIVIPSGDSSFSHPIVQPTQTTTYTCTILKDSILFSKSVTITVDTSCLRLYIGKDSTICLGDSMNLFANIYGKPLAGNNFTFTWSASTGIAPPSGIGNGHAYPSIKPSANTIYICNVTGGWKTVIDSVNIFVDSTCGPLVNSINTFDQSKKIQLFPNPASAAFTLLIPQLNNHQNAKVVITDMLGHKACEQILSNEQTVFNTQNYRKGVYTISVYANDFYWISKLVVE